MDNQIVVRNDMPLQDLGNVLARSGFFSDTKDAAQAIVKVLAGRELGFGPVASMTGFYIVKGRVTMSANMMAAAIKRSGKYNYRVTEMTDKACEIAFFENKQEVGRSRFTAEDARRAGTQNMDKFPRNMLFARALSNGAKWYCADIFGGPMYTPEEMGERVNEDGEPLELRPTPLADVTVIDPQEITEPMPPHEQPAGAGMTLTEAEAVQNSEGLRYGDLPSDKLAYMANSISKLLQPTPEHEKKLLAIQTILKARNGKGE